MTRLNACPTDASTGWCCHEEGDDHLHVHPLGDLIDHDFDDDGGCVCGPTTEFIPTSDGDAWMLTHHALDNREADEA